MPPLPKRRWSTRRQGKKRARLNLVSLPNLTKCPNCGQSQLSHRVCPNCGFYKGKIVLSVKKKKKSKNENRSRPAA
jgi:large subunit ribosomal protein L32